MDKFYGPPETEARITYFKRVSTTDPPMVYLQPLSGCTCLWSNTVRGPSSIVSRDPNCLMHGQKDSE